jgi:hypothetical protein
MNKNAVKFIMNPFSNMYNIFFMKLLPAWKTVQKLIFILANKKISPQWRYAKKFNNLG